MNDEEPIESRFGLIMPFVVCESAGGPLDDNSFVVGFELGQIDALLNVCKATGTTPDNRYVHEVGVPQLDLVAMHHGFMLEVGEVDEYNEWRSVGFRRMANDEDGSDE